LDKKVSYFQTFGLDVLLFIANAAKAKELREGNQPLIWCGWGRKRKIEDSYGSQYLGL
jgi:hypothetical protein